MPTFTAIALDRLLEPGASKTVMKSASDLKPVPDSKLERRNSTSTVTTENKPLWSQISPALYATPEATPLPDSPSSFPPSPYIINHKRRGPRLIKSFSQYDVPSGQKIADGEGVNGNAKDIEPVVVESANNGPVTFTVADPIVEEPVNGFHNEKPESSNSKNVFATENGPSVAVNSERDGDGDGDGDDFFDPQESMSFTSNTEGEDFNGAEHSLKLTTPMGEFYDAWEELSSEGAQQPSLCEIEDEMREIRLGLLMEIEKRKQAEEALKNMRNVWQTISQQLSLVGLTLPADLAVVGEDGQPDVDIAQELSQQVSIARFVSDSIGRGIAKAQVEMEMEAQIDSKNFEIARLWDRLHYYDAVNREMSQRNQEGLELARRERQRRKRRQRWVWGSIAAVITVGTAALAWSYLPTGQGSSGEDHFEASEHDHETK
ncbi:uncharacterized protein LOC117912952 [Vitis riparia]|uniref:uncharacterized protein LOC117912952 n=1 Tax=Vitis riparia TaxID=96939 RepID=UPI00155B2D1B|nr:uncharacterized protein LOC117912952 [Vitis riparia]